MINKKGQEGVTLTTLLLIVIGVVVVVVIILGATGILGDIFGGGKKVIPSDLEATTQACRIAAAASLVNDYCYRFREIGDDIYANCEDARIKNALTQQEVDLTKIDCSLGDADLMDNALRDFCEGKNDKVEIYTVAGKKTCGNYAIPDSIRAP